MVVIEPMTGGKRTMAPTRSLKRAKFPKDLKKGQMVQFTQTIVSKVDPIMMDKYWTFYLPDWAAFGKIHTHPKALNYKQANRREEARERAGVDRRNADHLRGKDGEIMPSHRRGSMYLQMPQKLKWNIGPLVAEERYKISFKIKIIADPPTGTTDVDVISIFEHLVMHEVDPGMMVPIINCEIDNGQANRPACGPR